METVQNDSLDKQLVMPIRCSANTCIGNNTGAVFEGAASEHY
jgi:hypothetical protein